MTTAPAPTVPRVSAIVVSYNTREDLLRCLTSLERHVTLPLETVVVDNASSDDSAAAVRARFAAAVVVENAKNLGFGRACNLGLAVARAPYRLLLNSDAEVLQGAVEAMAALLDARPQVGLVGPRILSEDGSVQVSYGPPLEPWWEWKQRRLVRGVRERRPDALRKASARASTECEPAWISAACLLARAETLQAVGGFDDAFFLYEEDVDLCARVRQAGWRILFTPTAEVIHHLGRSMEQVPDLARLEYQRSHLRYYRKHNPAWQTAALRASLFASSALRWLAAIGPGPKRQARRRLEERLLALSVAGG
jgi:N-acetylglucosaminyl-diphospho-decaprenol L-rhamnosyltransferase